MPPVVPDLALVVELLAEAYHPLHARKALLSALDLRSHVSAEGQPLSAP